MAASARARSRVRVFIVLLRMNCRVCSDVGQARDIADERIALSFLTDRCRRTVAGMHQGLVVEREQTVANRCENAGMGAAPEIGAPDPLQKKRVAGKENRR